jgi:hypothetical protein
MLVAFCAGAAAPAAGQPKETDWPCIQRKVITLTSAQIWDGPPTEDLKGWEEDDEIKNLADVLESRRVSLEDGEKAIKAFAEEQPADQRDQKLTLLFASLLNKTNKDRQFVLKQIVNYQKRQQARAFELQRQGQELEKNKQSIPPQEQMDAMLTLTPEQQQYQWDARIFREREQNLTMACEIPVLIEQRVYEIGRLIRAQMTD